MPSWVQAGYDEYAGRMTRECRLELREIPLGRRTRGSNASLAIREEGQRMLAALEDGDLPVSLDVTGRSLSTTDLARRLAGWMQSGRDVALMIGGPDGLAPACLERAEFCWSLSPLTLPHGLVRIVVAEQLYRAASLLRGHPYHRA